MSSGTEIEDGDGISHKKEGGLKLEFNWEKQANNTYVCILMAKFKETSNYVEVPSDLGISKTDLAKAMSMASLWQLLENLL